MFTRDNPVFTAAFNQPHPIFQTPLNLSNTAHLLNPAESFKSRSKQSFSSGADRFFLPPSLLRRSRSAKSRHLSSIPREGKLSTPPPTPPHLSPSPPPLAPSASESPPTSAAVAPQILDPSACNKYAPPDSPAS